MSREKDPECRGVLMGETDNAICVAKERHGSTHWIPRSQIGYMRKDTMANGSIDVVFTVPEWLLEKKQAWDLVP